MTGTSMGRLMPEVLEPLTTSSGATFKLMVLENQLFGPSVTSAGLLSGRSFSEALSTLETPDLDLLLLPAEAVNDNGLFLDDLSFESLQRMTDIPIHLSKTFVDVLPEGGAA
jgi:hypothetical protein